MKQRPDQPTDTEKAAIYYCNPFSDDDKESLCDEISEIHSVRDFRPEFCRGDFEFETEDGRTVLVNLDDLSVEELRRDPSKAVTQSYDDLISVHTDWRGRRVVNACYDWRPTKLEYIRLCLVDYQRRGYIVGYDLWPNDVPCPVNGCSATELRGEYYRAIEKAEAPGDALRLRVRDWLRDRGVACSVRIGPDGEVSYRIPCPFESEGHGVIFQAANGHMSFQCGEDACRHYDWQEARKAIGPTEPRHYVRKQAASTIAPGTLVLARDRGNFGTVVADNGPTCTVHFVSPDGGTADVELPKAELTLQDGTPLLVTDETRIEVIPSSEFDGTRYRQHYLVKNVLVAEQPAIVGGRSKTMKTTLMVDMTVSLGTGTPFLGEFPTTQARTALLSGESGGFTVQETARRVCQSRGISLSAVEAVWGFRLPQLARAADLTALGDMILTHGIEVAIIDPAYLCLLGGDTQGRQAANLFDMGPLLLGLSEVGNATNATIVLCHHCRKNLAEPWQPPELEDLAMAGFGEWARQWILLGRREEYEQGSGQHKLWMNVGGSAGHSGLHALDIDEGRLLDDFTGRKWNVAVGGATEAKRDAQQQRNRQKAEKLAEREEECKRRLLAALKQYPGGETKSVLKDAAGLNAKDLGTALRFLLAEGRVESCELAKSGRIYPGYRWVEV